MARLILKMPYIKSGNAPHKSNFVKYIATREGVAPVMQNTTAPATKKQEELVAQLVKDFPSSKTLFEYEDYKESPTIGNASDFITMALEQNYNAVAKRENYVDYIANRPRVQKLTSHGLFTAGDEKVVLSQVAEEIANHDGNVWTPIISLHREDAMLTDFENAEHWKNMLTSQASRIAQELKIPVEHFRWYAAFHDEGHHPHVHMICYSTDPQKKGYLSRDGIKNIKSGLVGAIFKDQLHELYLEKDMRRAELKQEAEKALQELKASLQTGNCYNPKLELLMVELQTKLKTVTGKKQYGYLRPPLKNLINQIVDELGNQPEVATAFEKWQELQDELYSSYQDTKPLRVPLSQQKEFKSIKNMVIREVMDMEFKLVEPQLIAIIKIAEEPTHEDEPKVHQTQEPPPQQPRHTQSNTWQNPAVGSAVLRLLKQMEQLFQSAYSKDATTQHQRIDSKSMQLLRQKKLAQGLKISTLDEQQDFQQQQY